MNETDVTLLPLIHSPQVQKELDLVFNHFQVSLESPWKIVCECSQHLHPLMISNFIQRWSTFSSEMQQKLTLAIIGIYRKRFKDDKIREATQEV